MPPETLAAQVTALTEQPLSSCASSCTRCTGGASDWSIGSHGTAMCVLSEEKGHSATCLWDPSSNLIAKNAAIAAKAMTMTMLP